MLPVNHLWIAAIAVEWSLPLLTNDEHFSLVSGLRVASV
jgi:predicted nucleic acid-binding protein